MSEASSTGAPSPGPFGANPHRVIELLHARAERLARGESREDGRKIALVVEGGSLRGVMSAGGMLALSRMGMDDAFDHIFATSAGVMNASYFLSKQPDLGISIYYEELTTKSFINPRRLWKILNLDYVFDEVVVKLKPLDLETLHRSTTQFDVAAIDCRSASAVLIDAIRGPEPTLACLKAATAIPVLYNRCVMIDGKPCIDGGMLNAIPVRDAINAGCTDIVVMLTQPEDYVRTRFSWFQRVMFYLLFARGRPALARMLQRYPSADHELRQLALGRSPLPRDVNVATFCPTSDHVITGYAEQGDQLWRAAHQYCEHVLSAFGRSDVAPSLAPPRAAVTHR